MRQRGNGGFVAVVNAALIGVLIWVGIEVAQRIGRH